jgi:hypothetical protein
MEWSWIQSANRVPQTRPSPTGGSRHRLGVAVWAAVVLVASASAATAAKAASPVTDQPAAVVQGVVMPAWLERSGTRQPVVPGMVLQERDRIVTGANARILLTLPEGSSVKLGESAQLDLDSLSARQEGGSVFLKSALNVVVGAFRFTTSALNKVNNRRDVSIRLATVTAGIRGTDLWGKQGGDKRLSVCWKERLRSHGTWLPRRSSGVRSTESSRALAQSRAGSAAPRTDQRRIQWKSRLRVLSPSSGVVALCHTPPLSSTLPHATASRRDCIELAAKAFAHGFSRRSR